MKKHTYLLFDYYDEDQIKHVKHVFDHKLVAGETFVIDDVTYEVTKLYKNMATIKMTRYLIPDSSTSFIHKCSARQGEIEKMTDQKIDKLKEKYGEKQVLAWKKEGRTKMNGMKLATVCPYCQCAFYKNNVEVPEQVQITAITGRKKLVRRL